MEPVISLAIAVLIIVGTAMALGAIASILGTPQERHVDADSLTYCQYCGCRHRIRWMTWEDGQYHCNVCCARIFR